jgi:hypothetical protein
MRAKAPDDSPERSAAITAAEQFAKDLDLEPQRKEYLP